MKHDPKQSSLSAETHVPIPPLSTAPANGEAGRLASPPPPRARSSGLIVIFAFAVLGLGAVVMSGAPMPWQAGEQEPTVPAPPPLGVELIKNDKNPKELTHTLRVPEEVRTALGIRKGDKDILGVTKLPTESRPLVLPGSTLLDPTRVTRIRARFAPAEVVEIGKPRSKISAAREDRELRAGDTVAKGDVLGIFYSVEVGSKKNDLFEAIVQQRLDKAILERAEKSSGAVAEVFLWTARRNYDTDRSAVFRILNTLKTWNIADEEVEDVIKEAEALNLAEGRRDSAKEQPWTARLQKWASVVLKAPEAGIIVERNVAKNELVVDNTISLFVLARVEKLTVAVNAPEDLLPILDKLKGPWRRWTINTAGASAGQGIECPIDEISYLVDPNQHSLVIKGHLDNPGLLLRGGQYVTATINLPPPDDVVEIPTDAVVDDGKQCVVFVQTDPRKPDHYTMRRVQLTHRFDRTVYVRSKPFDRDESLPADEEAEGLMPRQPLREGEKILLTGILELKKELEDREASLGPAEGH